MNSSEYNTYGIRVANTEHVRAVKSGPDRSPSVLSGAFRYEGDRRDSILALHKRAVAGNLTGSEAGELGELLFDILFDERLRHDFFEFHEQTRKDKRILRVELDVDERALPEIAALPWEFLRIASDSDYGTVTLSTAPDMVFSRRRASWKPAPSFQPEPLEYLRIVLAVAAPQDIGPGRFDQVKSAIEELARVEPVELAGFIEHADRKKIDEALRKKKPHIFHFIGHGKFDPGESGGRLALEDFAGYAQWVKAENFAELFNTHRPGVLVLQSCETAAMDAAVPFSSIAARMVEQNIPVVAAMQYAVSNSTAGVFSKAFYQRIAENASVDTAVQEGRRSVSMYASGNSGRDFATPVIFTRTEGGGRLFDRIKPDSETMERAVREAGRDERTKNYRDALKKWKCVHRMEPENTEAVEAVDRLTEKNIEKQTMQKILMNLSGKMNEIKPVYVPVARYLKRMDAGGVTEDGEIFLAIVNNYLSGMLTPEEFMDMWRDMETKPVRTETEPNYDILADRLVRGEVIPFFGSDILNLSGAFDFSTEKLGGILADGADYREFEGPLSMIAQYCQMTEYGRSKLIRTVRDEFIRALEMCRPFAFYETLAGIRTPIMVISACYDNTLEKIFTDFKKPFAVLSHAGEEGELKGKMLVKYWDRDASEEPCTAENLSDYHFLSNGYSVIYKIWGCLSLYKAVPASDPMILAEDDFFSFAGKMEKLVPDYLTTQLFRRSLLFLGYTIREWQDRLIINEIMKRKRMQRERSYAVIEQPDRYEQAFWKTNGTDIYRKNLNVFVEKLCESVINLTG